MSGARTYLTGNPEDRFLKLSEAKEYARKCGSMFIWCYHATVNNWEYMHKYFYKVKTKTWRKLP